MKNTNQKSRAGIRGTAIALTLAMLAIGTLAIETSAQDTTRTIVQHGESSYDTQVRNAEVVYVEGNDLVLKLEDGKVEHLVVPESDKFTIDGNDVTVRELTPGTKLTQTITTTTVPRYVKSIRTLKGKVWHVNPPRSVILHLPDGSNQPYTVPDHAKFTIEGKTKTVFDLRKGMTLEVTIVTDDTHTVMEQSKSVVGQAPIVETPRELGVLLVFHPIPAPVIEASDAQPELASTLPKTGSLLPLGGLLGSLSLAASFGLGAVRRALKV